VKVELAGLGVVMVSVKENADTSARVPAVRELKVRVIEPLPEAVDAYVGEYSPAPV
jgi:hypothetical protein